MDRIVVQDVDSHHPMAQSQREFKRELPFDPYSSINDNSTMATMNRTRVDLKNMNSSFNLTSS